MTLHCCYLLNIKMFRVCNGVYRVVQRPLINRCMSTTIDNDNIDDVLALAKRLRKSGNYEEAVKNYNKAYNIYLRSGDYRKGIAYWDGITDDLSIEEMDAMQKVR